MIASMTGYGRAQKQINGRDITVELRSVNHRFFELSCRLPRHLGFMEERLKRRLQPWASRGKADLFLQVQAAEAEVPAVRLNEAAAAAYADAFRRLAALTGLSAGVSVEVLARFPDIFTVEKPEEDEEALWQAVCEVFDEAAERFAAMRAQEGERLAGDILQRLAQVEAGVGAVENAAERLTGDYRRRLTARLTELLDGRAVDEGRLLTEVALFAERTDVGEETVRLRSHLAQFRAVLAGGGAMGRKLDFLTQELNREANTIGSKIQDLALSETVVGMKSDIEKIREQIQNLE